jgi:hypothetical protein
VSSKSIFVLALVIVGALFTCSYAFHRIAPLPDYLTRFSEPGGTAEEARLAVTNPSEYAWRLFSFLNRQAADGAGEPDKSKPTYLKYDDNRAVIWETWALDNDHDGSEVFSCPPKRPISWDSLKRDAASKDSKSLSLNFTNSSISTKQELRSKRTDQQALSQAMGPLPPEPDGDSNQEVRVNRSLYDTIRDQSLWSQEGILQAVSTASSTSPRPETFVTFKPAAKAVKAKWIFLCFKDEPSCEEKRRRYHWRSITYGDGKTKIWALAALHIMTRDLEKWFWADFIHKDCLDSNNKNCKDWIVGTEVPPAEPDPRLETKGTKWENYRLMGTETDFTTPIGHAQRLANPTIESKTDASCITCHAYAATATLAKPPLQSIVLANRRIIGVPEEDAFCGDKPCQTSATRKYFQSSFLWSILFNAKAQNSECSNSLR